MCDGQFHFHQHLVGLKRRGQRADEKIRRGDPAFAPHRLRAQLAGERQDDSRHFRGGVGVRQIAANGSAIANLRVRDVGQRFMDQGQVACGCRIAFELAVACERADADAVRQRRFLHSRKLRQRIDIDQHGRLREPKIHCRNKALTARQKMRLVAVFGLQL